MPKFRSRHVVNAVQWFPGKTIPGIQEIGGFAFYSFNGKDFLIEYEVAYLVRPGDYVLLEKGSASGVRKKDEFEKGYEDVGGE